MGWLRGACRTGGASGNRHFSGNGVYELVCQYPREADAQVAWHTLRKAAEGPHCGVLAQQRATKARPESLQTLRISFPLRVCDLACRSHTHDERCGQCSRTKPGLLRTTAQYRSHSRANAVADKQDADPVRPVELVRGQTEQINPQVLDVHRHSASSLSRVTMDKRANSVADFDDLCKRLNDTDLVVREHDGHQKRSAVHDTRERLYVQQPVRPNLHDVYRKALAPKSLHSLQNGWVFRPCRHDVSPITASNRNAPYREIARLGCTGDEEDLTFVCADEVRNLSSRNLDRLAGLPPVPMTSGVRVSECGRPIRLHGFRYPWVEWRGRLVVQVDRHRPFRGALIPYSHRAIPFRRIPTSPLRFCCSPVPRS